VMIMSHTGSFPLMAVRLHMLLGAPRSQPRHKWRKRLVLAVGELQ
jgi:hypothetical protein